MDYFLFLPTNMANNHWSNWNHECESMHNLKNNFFDARKEVIDQTQIWTENLRESTIDYSISSTSTKSDLIIHQKWLEYERGAENVPLTTNKRVDYSNMDWWETFQQWWISGILDKVLTNCSNMTSWQVDTRKTLWVLGIVGWVIYGQYKFYTSEEIWWWTKIWLTILPIFWSHFLTWEDPITLFRKLMVGGLSMNELKNKFGNAVWWLWVSWSECAETTVPAMQSMMIFNSWTTAGNVHKMTQSFIEDNRNWENFYKQSCDKIYQEYGLQSLECFQATLWNNFDQEKRNNWLSSFWETEWTKKNTTIHELATNAHTNKTIIEKFLADNYLKITNDPIKKAEFNNFIKLKNQNNESINDYDLQNHINDRFIHNEPQQTQQNHKVQNQQTDTNETQIPQTDNQNTENHELQTQNIEIQTELLQVWIEKWLSKSFSHFQSKYWSLLTSFAWIKQSSIKKYSPWITTNIKSEVCRINWKTITLDLSDRNLKQVYDNFIYELGNSSSILVKGKIKKFDWNWLSTELSKFRLKWDNDKYELRKENFSFVFNSLFEEIIPILESQWWDVKITCNWREFTNINDAINSLQLFS